MRWLKEHWVPLALSVMAGTVLVCCFGEFVADVDYRARCEGAGHRIVDRNGHWLCVSDDGRVIEP